MRCNAKHPYFQSGHYQEVKRLNDQKLRSLGFNQQERAHLHTKMEHEMLRWLHSNEMIYLKLGIKEIVLTR